VVKMQLNVSLAPRSLASGHEVQKPRSNVKVLWLKTDRGKEKEREREREKERETKREENSLPFSDLSDELPGPPG